MERLRTFGCTWLKPAQIAPQRCGDDRRRNRGRSVESGGTGIRRVSDNVHRSLEPSLSTRSSHHVTSAMQFAATMAVPSVVPYFLHRNAGLCAGCLGLEALSAMTPRRRRARPPGILGAK